MLRAFADHPDLTDDGTVTDHTGRPGVVVSHVEGDRLTRLVFDERTTALLSSHQGVGATAWPTCGCTGTTTEMPSRPGAVTAPAPGSDARRAAPVAPVRGQRSKDA